MIRILLADDHKMFREGVRSLLEARSDMAVVGEAATGEEALAAATEHRPDVVILDVSMPGRGGLETVSELKRRNPKVRVLMLTVHPEDRFAVRCLKGGADGYMTKEAAADELIGAIRKVFSGGKYVSPSLAESLVLSLERDFGAAPHETLSDREFQVMRMIASARTVSQIAEELCLSVKTISTYRSRILEKLGLRNNAEIMQYAMEQHLVELGGGPPAEPRS
ncbi:MAG TPA: response regulator transcription factor [Thermoanaerobaculia bacterium]|nr:response regulator transcription factor [Thermoanaerobaculia bacterium]